MSSYGIDIRRSPSTDQCPAASPSPPASSDYRWEAPHRIDVTLEHGVPRRLHAWFEIDEVEGGTRIHHVEEMDLGRGPLGWLYDRVGGRWFADSVRQEVDEIARLLEAGERGLGVAAHDEGARQPR
jgi:hypothetical protein